MKDFEERTCRICGMKFKTKDGRVKTCHRHKPRYNEDMKKKSLDEMLVEHKQDKLEKKIMIINFILNCIIAFGVTCNLILNIVK